jgi:hypothetical protein
LNCIKIYFNAQNYWENLSMQLVGATVLSARWRKMMRRNCFVVTAIAAVIAVSASDFAAAQTAGRGGRSAGAHGNVHANRGGTGHRNVSANHNVNVNRNVNVNVNRNVNRNVHVGVGVGVVRPWVRRPYFGTVVGGVVLGTMIAVSVVPPVPAPGLCWYWVDPSQAQGYWDYCQ